MQNRKTQNHQIKSRVLSRYDREMATIRNKNFLNEYNEFRALKNSNDIQKARRLEKEIIKKWNLADLESLGSIMRMKPKLPYGPISITTGKPVRIPIKVLEPYFDYLEMLKKNSLEIMPVTDPTNLPPLDFFSVTKSEDGTESVHRGEYILLKVPIMQTKKRLMKDFEQVVNALKRKDKTRNKEYQYNPWIVYDLCTSYGYELNFAEIALRFSGVKRGRHNDNPNFTASLKAVERAYRKACEMIEQVGK